MLADLTFGGYSDWFLPSKDELNEMYLNRAAIGGFDGKIGDYYYWSSSQHNGSRAWIQAFDEDNRGDIPKDFTEHVRAIRAF